MTDKILVVDDDTDGLKLIGLMLQRQGYEVIAAGNGSQALAKASSESPDLVILDVMMPDMDGYEVCRRLHNNPETANIPIIMFTAKTLIDDKAAGFEAGADDYLTKPTHPTELAARIKATLEKKRRQSRIAVDSTEVESTPVVKPPEVSPSKSRSTGFTIGVIGTRGGLGTTTVAINIATAFAPENLNPIVADFQLGDGSLAFYLGHKHSENLANVLKLSANEISPQLVEQALIKHESGIRALASSTKPLEITIKPGPEQILATVKALRNLSKVVVFDLGCRFNSVVHQLHSRLDQLVLLVEPDLLSVAVAKEMLKALEKDKPGRVNIIVASRLKHNYQPAWQDVEQALNHAISGIISPAPELAYEAIEAKTPVVFLKPESVLASQMTSLAKALLNPN